MAANPIEIPHPPEKPSSADAAPGHVVCTALLFAATAALGGIAVALWHRRTLAQLRKETGTNPEIFPAEEDADEQ
ncbi:hypothetical protein [Paracidobacterium acidisoli]|uniref:hypothetical protein n=1 Tax=Paracidobacterium acidisoli TaxID=2303751 RepID=UPI0011C10F88|nr:hypothetical protein [Paracidobacterium acidisoli]MBT9330974.1 hypothetical protein [Paracidobacterium acidisoli]